MLSLLISPRLWFILLFSVSTLHAQCSRYFERERDQSHLRNFYYSPLSHLFWLFIIVVNFLLCLIYKFNFVICMHVLGKHSVYRAPCYLQFQAWNLPPMDKERQLHIIFLPRYIIYDRKSRRCLHAACQSMWISLISEGRDWLQVPSWGEDGTV